MILTSFLSALKYIATLMLATLGFMPFEETESLHENNYCLNCDTVRIEFLHDEMKSSTEFPFLLKSVNTDSLIKLEFAGINEYEFEQTTVAHNFDSTASEHSFFVIARHQ